MIPFTDSVSILEPVEISEIEHVPSGGIMLLVAKGGYENESPVRLDGDYNQILPNEHTNSEDSNLYQKLMKNRTCVAMGVAMLSVFVIACKYLKI